MHRRTFLKAAVLGAGLTLFNPWPRPATAGAVPFTVYLTFDDGPTTFPDLTGPTTNVLNTLKSEGVPATFFLHGRAINKWEGPILARMIAEGHTVGNHLWRQGGNTVKDLTPWPLLAQQFIITEQHIRSMLQAADEAAYNTYLAQPKLFRRPGGNNGLTAFLDPKHFESLSHATYLQSYKDQLDWLKNVYDYSGWHINGGDGITNRKIQPDTVEKMVPWILNGGFGYQGLDNYLCTGKPARRSVEVEGGLIILLHDADKVTGDALPQVIRELRNRGAVFRALPRPQDKPNTRTVGIGYEPTPDPTGAACEPANKQGA
ncbi:MAG: polysaccharide deacetylase family protein [Anaerolineae bacterium]|nr:polysaccharide deacetylase family protein [Anaerolineae bacterium]